MSHAKILAFLACLVLFSGIFFFDFQNLTPISSPADNLESTETVVVDGNTVRVEIADTPEKRAQGLSGKSGLAPDGGMLFVFPEEENQSFWMKDMLFSIDIVWISSRGEVVGIEKNTSPESYPAVFHSPVPVRYVLEMPAGFSDLHAVKVGSKVLLE